MTDIAKNEKVDLILRGVDAAVENGAELSDVQDGMWNDVIRLQMDEKYHLALVTANKLAASLSLHLETA